MIGHRGEYRIKFARLLSELRFERPERRVDYRLVCDQEFHEILKRLGIQIQRMRVLRDERETLQRARVGIRFDVEIQQYLVDVLNLIVAALHRILSLHEGRDMAAHAQAALMGIGRGLRHPLRLEGVVDLDLRITPLRVEIDGALGALETLDENPAACVKWALALDESGSNHVRTDRLVTIQAANRLPENRVVIPHVAHGGNTGREI